MKNAVKLPLGIACQLIGLLLAELILWVPINVLYLFDFLDWEYTWSMTIPLGPFIIGIIYFVLWFLWYQKKIRNLELMDFAMHRFHVWRNLAKLLGMQIAAGIIVQLLAIGLMDTLMIVPMMPITIISSAVGMLLPDLICFLALRPGAN